MGQAPDDLSPDELARAAAFFATQPEFLGYWLERYAEEEQMETATLARLLGCSVEGLFRIKLCLTPRRERLESDVGEIAERFAVDLNRLADVLLAVWGAEAARSLGARRGASTARGASGYPAFAAASDREP